MSGIENDIVACKIATKECRCLEPCRTTDCVWWRVAQRNILRSLEERRYAIVGKKLYNYRGVVLTEHAKVIEQKLPEGNVCERSEH